MCYFIMIIIIIFILYVIIAIIIYIIIHKVYKRKTKFYNMAKKRAKETDKNLMVIGDPQNGSFFNRYFTHKVFGTPYDYGDLCIDLGGCPENKGYTIKDRIENIIHKFHTNSYVIYISQTLEYLEPDILNYVIKELVRVSNKDLFIVNMTFDNDSYTDRHGRFIRYTYFTKTPPEYNVIEYYHLDNKNKKHIIYLDDKY